MSNLHSMLMGGIVWKRKNKTMPDAVCSDDANANQVHPVNNNPVRSNDNDYKCQKCQMTKVINFWTSTSCGPIVWCKMVFHLPSSRSPKVCLLWDAVLGFCWHVRSQSTQYQQHWQNFHLFPTPQPSSENWYSHLDRQSTVHKQTVQPMDLIFSAFLQESPPHLTILNRTLQPWLFSASFTLILLTNSSPGLSGTKSRTS